MENLNDMCDNIPLAMGFLCLLSLSVSAINPYPRCRQKENFVGILDQMPEARTSFSPIIVISPMISLWKIQHCYSVQL